MRIFVGGSDEAAASVGPLLEPLGQPLHVGPLGAGASAKLVANTTLLGTMALLGEALALAKSLGLDREAAFEVLSTTPLSAQAERRRPVIEGAEPPVRFRLALATKDADVIVDEGRRAGVEAEIAKVAAALFRAAEEAGDGDRDYSATLRRSVDAAGAPRAGWAS